ncbi:MAG TPA: glycoside hydrolase family 3 N-terminal domain-containing protein, partial [Propioniciclava tarda]|nr:glycoside hydrolase family 3 N-terminal domain-containing protein [Propioniciclava tarda]
PFAGTYAGRPFSDAAVAPHALSDQQRTMLADDQIRHVLLMQATDAATAARWNNELQALAEELPFGVPVNTSSDPRNGAAETTAEFKSTSLAISRWPEGLGMAALFDPDACRTYASIISREYRALGITTALGPQADLGTEPRWLRLEDTWGPHSGLVTDYTRAYCDGMQTTPGEASGWGRDSVATMVKHWPGGGTGEGGRDAHYPFGAYAVYPGDNRAEHLLPFTRGAFALAGPTLSTAAVMPYYTVSDGYGPRVANSYNAVVIALLRDDYGYDGVLCTDWGITGDPSPTIDSFSQRSYGVEHRSVAERHLLALDCGLDQFGGNSDVDPVLDAYRLLAERDGEASARARFEASGRRLLRTFFRCGLFENPYLDADASASLVGCAEFLDAGYRAQLGSLVLLKGSDAIVQPTGLKVWTPTRHVGEHKSFFRTVTPARDVDPFNPDAVVDRFVRAERPEDADVAVVFIESPISDGGYADGYVPIPLVWGPYTADTAREPSLAGGDPREASADRSYRGRTVTAANSGDADLVRAAREAMGERPVIVVLRLHHPPVLTEIEPYADAILVDLGVSSRSVWDVIAGAYEPSGLLPLPLPASMETVEAHCEDLGFDYAVYTDAAGNSYDFGYGLNWSGRISDDRTRRYARI